MRHCKGNINNTIAMWLGKTGRKKSIPRYRWSDIESCKTMMLRFMPEHIEYTRRIGCSLADLLGRGRVAHLAELRAAAMYAMRQSGVTLHTVAFAFNRVNHATIIAADRKVRDHIEAYGYDDRFGIYIKEALDVYAVSKK